MLNITDDVILGIPFEQTIIVLHQDWHNHVMKFQSRSGQLHVWYGIGHESPASHALQSSSSMSTVASVFPYPVLTSVDTESGGGVVDTAT